MTRFAADQRAEDLRESEAYLSAVVGLGHLSQVALHDRDERGSSVLLSLALQTVDPVAVIFAFNLAADNARSVLARLLDLAAAPWLSAGPISEIHDALQQGGNLLGRLLAEALALDTVAGNDVPLSDSPCEPGIGGMDSRDHCPSQAGQQSNRALGLERSEVIDPVSHASTPDTS